MYYNDYWAKPKYKPWYYPSEWSVEGFYLLFFLTGIVCIFGYLFYEHVIYKPKEHPERFYVNVDLVILQKEENVNFGKYTSLSRKVLVGLATDTTMCTELESDRPEIWYNRRVGQRLHYDYIAKARFFKVR